MLLQKKVDMASHSGTLRLDGCLANTTEEEHVTPCTLVKEMTKQG